MRIEDETEDKGMADAAVSISEFETDSAHNYGFSYFFCQCMYWTKWRIERSQNLPYSDMDNWSNLCSRVGLRWQKKSHAVSLKKSQKTDKKKKVEDRIYSCSNLYDYHPSPAIWRYSQI